MTTNLQDALKSLVAVLVPCPFGVRPPRIEEIFALNLTNPSCRFRWVWNFFPAENGMEGGVTALVITYA